MILTTANQDFKVTPIVNVEYGINGPYLGLQWTTNKNYTWPWTILSNLQNFSS